MSPVVITLIAVFVGTASLCAGVGLSLLGKQREHPLDRLARLNKRMPSQDQQARVLKQEMWAESAAELAELWARIGFSPRSIVAWFAAAELPFRVVWLIPLSLLTGLVLVAGATVLKAPLPVYPIAGVAGVCLPMFYVVWRRNQRIHLFSSQLPDALELMASSLRSGNTVQSAMQIIADELMPPVSREFANVSESIRLGIPVDQALDEMAARVKNTDLEFFVTAVGMQRSCGGDLSEILDKISWLIRERFHIQGQVQALTGEGRMSGAVLLALPVVLFIAVYTLNPDYVMMLFTEPLGRKMLGGAILMQLIGAVVIRKIINIKI
jgi:tight adherence protein B